MTQRVVADGRQRAHSPILLQSGHLRALIRTGAGGWLALPSEREQVQRHLVGPVLAVLQAWNPVVGAWWWAPTNQGCSEELHALAREGV